MTRHRVGPNSSHLLGDDKLAVVHSPDTAASSVLVLILVTAVFLLLMEVVFPWVAAQLPHTDVTV